MTRRLARSYPPLALMVALAACGGKNTPPPERAVDTAATAPATSAKAPTGESRPVAAKPETTAAVPRDGRNAIIPGKQVGGVKIGEEMGDVIKALGEPDSSDGAMGHVWSAWISHRNDAERQELGVYAGFDKNATGHYVRQIRLTSPFFVTSGGVSTRSSLDDILRAFHGAHAIAKYHSDGREGTVYLYDDKEEGIAFEVVQGTKDPTGTCLAIVVHTPGEDVTGQYLSAVDYTPIGGGAGGTGGK